MPDTTSELGSNVRQLIQHLQRPAVKVDSLAKVIAIIPGLSEELLNQVNSPEFALRHPIIQLQHAIAYLGLRRVERTVLMFHVGEKHAVRAPHMKRNRNKIAEQDVA